MITQNFLMEFELALLKAYAKASHRGEATSPEHNFLGTVRLQEGFVSSFLGTFEEQRSILAREIQKGGHPDASRILSQIQKIVETKLRTALLTKGNKLDEATFKSVVRDLKWDVRSVFYA